MPVGGQQPGSLPRPARLVMTVGRSDQNGKPEHKAETPGAPTGKIEKSVLTFGEVQRRRDRQHLKFVATHERLEIAARKFQTADADC